MYNIEKVSQNIYEYLSLEELKKIQHQLWDTLGFLKNKLEKLEEKYCIITVELDGVPVSFPLPQLTEEAYSTYCEESFELDYQIKGIYSELAGIEKCLQMLEPSEELPF